MPFITQDRRDIITLFGLDAKQLEPIQPGDLCYVHYKTMVEKWKTNPRWTTAHEIMKHMVFDNTHLSDDDGIALILAWQVFFQLHVIPYELKKREENGDI